VSQAIHDKKRWPLKRYPDPMRMLNPNEMLENVPSVSPRFPRFHLAADFADGLLFRASPTLLTNVGVRAVFAEGGFQYPESDPFPFLVCIFYMAPF
jgi:hypothetical protein